MVWHPDCRPQQSTPPGPEHGWQCVPLLLATSSSSASTTARFPLHKDNIPRLHNLLLHRVPKPVCVGLVVVPNKDAFACPVIPLCAFDLGNMNPCLAPPMSADASLTVFAQTNASIGVTSSGTVPSDKRRFLTWFAAATASVHQTGFIPAARSIERAHVNTVRLYRSALPFDCGEYGEACSRD